MSSAHREDAGFTAFHEENPLKPDHVRVETFVICLNDRVKILHPLLLFLPEPTMILSIKQAMIIQGALMQAYLLTVDGIADSYEGNFRLTPRVLLHSLASNIIMPMPDDPLDLRLPNGRLLQARVASFGIDAWRDAGGNLLIDTDPANPELSLTITGVELSDILPGTEIWLSEPKFQVSGEPS